MSERRVKVKSLPVSVQKALMRAFKQTGLMDLYRGDVVSYLDVIREQLRDALRENRKMEEQFDRIAELARLKTSAK
jgi:hypothetical protein